MSAQTAPDLLNVEKKPTKGSDNVDLFLRVFNATFGRRCHVLPTLEAKTLARLRTWKPEQVIALPLLVAAQGLRDDLAKTLSPEVLLRDGKHARTTAAGYTCGATDWLERAYLKADQTVLDKRLTSIALAAEGKHTGIVAELERLGVRLTRADA